ncbi:LLM class flavin-dependent oxidoreductase [Amycolatopsis rubida]|uniref:LLM class flavin-dependent oxidoreductase n=1 Tax=Amycolatopsis rubida TaxID=112413 RepID=A0ABX0C4I9_9PSEU|nr:MULTISPECIES: LLM class flavin-dependent oxidoreductase [Amycolatopsis]MYW96182.1 NtaA/DmoA family FMN-dependent monooxygenase [Amycolatopsis rubida]NEC61173.1 LLM class flavin-dependent oxidoreductase [Amycolatopsis rubida]
MNLVLFFNPAGRLPASWRRPGSRVEELYGLPLAVDLARKAESARFDAIFLADVFYQDDLGRDPFTTGYEPFTLMSALCPVTERIGFIGTVSATFMPPYHLARYFASIDHLSSGRVGWNLVTSSSGGELFGMELPPKEERYARADEYLRLVKSLWDAYDDDAVVNDREARVWARADRIHPVDFEGEYFRFRGHLKVPRSPQGRPVIVQAGQSDAGMDFAARNAEVVFTAQTDLDRAREFYAEIKKRAAAHGRDPEKIKILPGIAPIIGATHEEARERADELAGLIDMESGRKSMEITLQGADLSGVDLDAPIPAKCLVPPESASDQAGRGASRYRNFYEMAVRDRMTLRQLIFESERGLGHSTVTGSVEQVADRFEEWWRAGACDGFAITPVDVPEGFDSVCEQLVPELQSRALFPKEYEGKTLREHLGLDRPSAPNRSR